MPATKTAALDIQGMTSHQLANFMLQHPDVPLVMPEKVTKDVTVNFVEVHSVSYIAAFSGMEGSISINHYTLDECIDDMTSDHAGARFERPQEVVCTSIPGVKFKP